MTYPVDEYGMEAGICENNLKSVPRSRVALKNRMQIPLYVIKETHCCEL